MHHIDCSHKELFAHTFPHPTSHERCAALFEIAALNLIDASV